jgi:hypothetical protein
MQKNRAVSRRTNGHGGGSSPAVEGSRAHRRKRRKPKKASFLGRVLWGGRSQNYKIYTVLVAVCMGAALFAGVAMKADLASVAGYLLFGSTDPYMSPEKFKKVGSEVRDMIKKEFAGN